MKKFRYKVVHGEPTEELLNDLGKQGWELIDAEHSLTSAEMIFKQEVTA